MGREFKLRSLLKLNLRFFEDMAMLRESAFFNVGSGQMFYDGGDMSLLLPDTNADDLYVGIENGQIWQSPFRQWVYESGVALDGTNVSTPPIQYSGVFIEGAFRGVGDPEFGHTPDFINGRIIFNQPQPLHLKVQASYSYREYRFGFEDDFNQQFDEGFLESKYMTNPGTSMQLVYPSGTAQPFPAVFIEVDDRDFEAYELGNRSAIIEDTVKFHIWAVDTLQRDDMVDILTAQWRKVLPIIDFNRVPIPLSGIFNTLSNEYIPYQTLLRNNLTVTTVGSGTPLRYLTYVDEVQSQNGGSRETYETALVTYRVKTYLNAPTTPLGHRFDPISTLPTIQDLGGL